MDLSEYDDSKCCKVSRRLTVLNAGAYTVAGGGGPDTAWGVDTDSGGCDTPWTDASVVCTVLVGKTDEVGAPVAVSVCTEVGARTEDTTGTQFVEKAP